MKTVFLVLLHWGYEYDSGVDYYLFDSYDKAYDKFKELIQDEIQNAWINNKLDDNGEPIDGYELDFEDNNSDETDCWWNFKQIGYSEIFSNIDLRKVEVK